jgi:hypothetical protein
MSQKLSSIPRIGPFTTMIFENAGYHSLNQLQYFDTCRTSDDYVRFIRDIEVLKGNQDYTDRFWKRMINRCISIINSIQIKNAMPIVPEFFICRISGCLMEEPVILPNGNSVERCEIEEWIDLTGNCPFTREPLSKQQLIENRNLQDVIEDYTKDHAKYELILFKFS